MCRDAAPAAVCAICSNRQVVLSTTDQVASLAAGGSGVIERDVGFREPFDDPSAARAANKSSSNRGADFEALTVPEERAAQHHDGLL